MSRPRKILASLFVAALLAAAVSAVVFSAFTSTTANSGNTFQAGSIRLSANAAAGAVFAMAGVKPGDSQARCVKVTLAAGGGLTSTVRLYGTSAGGGLDRYLTLRVLRGSFAGPAPAANGCAGFTPDRTTQGQDVALFDGNLADLPANYASGLVDTNGAWRDGDTAVYELVVGAQDDDRAQGLDATTEFDFQARNN